MSEPDTPQDKMFFAREQWHFPSGLDIDGELTLNGGPIAGGELISSPLDTGITTIPRTTAFSNIAAATQLLELCYFRASKNMPAVTHKMWSSATAAAATPTLVKYALFSVAANGDLTRIAITANDTALFSAINTAYPKAYITPTNLVAGLIYAAAFLIVTAGAAPTLPASNGQTIQGSILQAAPRLAGAVSAQADIAASYTAAQVNTLEPRRMYAEILAA